MSDRLDPPAVVPTSSLRPIRRLVLVLAAAACATFTLRAATPLDQGYFSSNTNVTNILVQYINAETVRLDISSWHLSGHTISIAIANRFAAGVPVRISATAARSSRPTRTRRPSTNDATIVPKP